MLPTRRRLGRLVTTLAIAAAPAVAVAATPSAAHADTDDCGVTGNLVTNCGFETGDTSGWTFSPAASGSALFVGTLSHSGYRAALFDGVGGLDDVLSQTIADTVPGQAYTASFWAMDGAPDGSHLAGSVSDTAAGAVTVVDQTDPSTSWTEYSVEFTASSTSPTLTISGFAGFNVPGFIVVDDVSVRPARLALPTDLPPMTYGTPYSASVAATGGTAPYTYQLDDAGDLPPGIVLDTTTGEIHGTPTVGGTESDFVVIATDADGALGYQAYSLGVLQAGAPTVTFDDPATGGVVGQTATLAASSTADGSITFSSDSTGVCSVAGTTVTYLHPGTCTLEADQASSANYAAGSATDTLTVAQATTTTTVAVHPTTITADVNVDSPGAGDPTGDVTFQVGDQVVGTAPVQNGTATLDYTVPTGTSNEVAATYAGDTDFTGSSASTSRNDPSITARLTSHSHKTAAGWYHSPVTVHFTCTTNGADLVQTCPAPVTLSKNVAGGSVTKTITATDGGAATVTVTGINIDHTAPQVHVTGIHNGATYQGKAPAAHCLATDRLSGIANCRITRHTHGSVTHYTATAKDKAGNTTSTHGTYRVLSTYLTGAPLHHGAFQVRGGRTYSLVTHAGSRPRYVDAAIVPQKPSGLDKAFNRVGHHTWAISVTMPRGHHRDWNLGIKVGKHLRIVRIHVR